MTRRAEARQRVADSLGRESFSLGHLRCEVEDHPVNGGTWCLRMRDGGEPKVPPPLVAGIVEPGMARELRRIAACVERIEARQRRERGQG